MMFFLFMVGVGFDRPEAGGSFAKHFGDNKDENRTAESSSQKKIEQ
jgi:hypothetical protein